MPAWMEPTTEPGATGGRSETLGPVLGSVLGSGCVGARSWLDAWCRRAAGLRGLAAFQPLDRVDRHVRRRPTMNESGWATTGDNAKRVDSGADSCRIDSVNDRSISDSRAVCGGWSRTERAYSPAVRGTVQRLGG
jgi:hypothetical protein